MKSHVLPFMRNELICACAFDSSVTPCKLAKKSRIFDYPPFSPVSYVVHEPLVHSYPLFGKITRKIVSALASKLTPEVYLPREYILVAGHVSRAMYFISRGKVALVYRSEAAAMAMATKGKDEPVSGARGGWVALFGTVTVGLVGGGGVSGGVRCAS